MSEGKSENRSWLRVLLGLGLLLPAILCCASVLVLPTLNTIVGSLQDKDLIRGQAQFIGFENYTRLFEDPVFSQALSFTLSLLVVRVLVVAVVPLLLALFVNEFGRWVRIPARLLFTVPLALFAPVAAGLAWQRALNPEIGLVNVILEGMGLPSQGWLYSADMAPVALMLVEGLTIFGIACGVGLVFYLAALRGAGEEAPSWREVRQPLLASWVVGLLAAVVLPLPAFTSSYVLTGGGPARATMTLGIYLFDHSFAYANFGYGSAIASPILVVAMVLGLIVGLIVVFGRLRLEMVGWGKRSGLFSGEGKPGWRKFIIVVLSAGVLFFSLAICSLGALPVPESVLTSLKSEVQIAAPESPFWPAKPRKYLYEGVEYNVYQVPTEEGIKEWALVDPRRSYFIDPANPEAGLVEWEGEWRTLKPVWESSLRWENYGGLGELMPPVWRVWGNTILPPLVVILLFQVPLAYLGALGIAVVRPFKKWSEVLLLLFSPWLFVTILPLSMVFFDVRREAGLLNTWGALAPPITLSVPALFILTLFFKGQERKWRAVQAAGQSSAGAFFTKLILPSLPLVALLVCASLLFSMQGLLWPLLVSAQPEFAPVSVALLRLSQLYGNQPPVVAASAVLLGLPLFLFFFLAFGLIQAFYLDRLALVAGEPDIAESPDKRALPEVGPVEEARETVRLEQEGAEKTVRLEVEGAKKTVRLEPEEAKTVRLEPGGAKETVRLEPEGAKKTVRLEPEGAKKTVRLEPEEAKTVRLRPEGEREAEHKDERKTVRLQMEDEGKTVRLGREEDDDAQS